MRILHLLLCLLFFSILHGQNVGIGVLMPADKLHVNGNIRLDNAGNAQLRFDKSGIFSAFIQHNGPNFQISNKSTGYIAFLTADNTRMVVLNDGKIGIGTTVPTAKLHVTDGSMVVTGPAVLPGSPEAPPVVGAGSRMLWYHDKMAFRAGFVDGNQWDKDSIGAYSGAVGYNPTANGSYSFVGGGTNNKAAGLNAFVAAGNDNFVSGSGSFAYGGSNEVSGNGSFAGGGSNDATANSAFVMGFENTASGLFSFVGGGRSNLAFGDNSFATGHETIARSFGEAVFGIWPTDYSPLSTSSYNASDRIFTVGNGTSDANRQNALVIMKDGSAAFTGRFNAVPALDPPASGTGPGMMWYGDKRAFRSGYAVTTDWDKDSIGLYSAALGVNVKAIGESTFVGGGTFNTARGASSFIGGGVTNQTTGSHAFIAAGRENLATSSYAFVGGGYQSTVSGEQAAVVGGFGNSASAPGSIVAGGQNNTASNHQAAVLGGINGEASGQHSAVVCGESNSATEDRAFVGGGISNQVEGLNSFIGGGQANVIDDIFGASNSGVVGGQINLIEGSSSFIGGGSANEIDRNFSFIAAGRLNTTIGESTFATGVGNTAYSLTEFVVGTYCTSYAGYNISAFDADDRVFVVGNGTADTVRSNALTVLKNGNVGIGVDVPTYQVQLSANSAAKPGGGSWANPSDVRIKKEIRAYRDGLQKILAVEPVTYQYNTRSGFDTTETHIGVIAQELQKVAPYMVKANNPDDHDSYLFVDNSAMTYMLVNSVQELAAENHNLRATLDAVTQELNTLKEQMRLLQEALSCPDSKATD